VLFHPQIGMGEGNGYLSDFPSKKEDLQGYDVVFLGDVGIGDGMLKKEQAELLRGLVEQQASGLVFLPGPLGRQKSLLDSAAQTICCRWKWISPRAPASPVPPRRGWSWTFRGRDHWLTMLATDPNANQAVWRGLPGFYWYAPVVKAKAGAEVLAVHEAARHPQYGRYPLLVTRAGGQWKVLFMGTDSAWRWRKGVEDTYHYRFWSQVVRWMSHQRHLAQDEGIRFFLHTRATAARRQGTAQRDGARQLGAPIGAAKVLVTLKAPSGTSETVELNSDDTEWGVHSGNFVPREGGKWKWKCRARAAGRKMKSTLEVTVPVLEKEGLPAKLDVLREISSLTSGKLIAPAEMSQLISSLSVLPERKPEELRWRLWCDPWWCAGLLVAFATYWVCRKIGG